MTIETAERRESVVGALSGDHPSVGRIVRIDDFVVDLPAEGCVLVLRNRDVPGVIGRVGTALGDAAVNIASYYQARRGGSGSEALAGIVVDQVPASDVLERLTKLPEVSEVRVAVVGAA